VQPDIKPQPQAQLGQISKEEAYARELMQGLSPDDVIRVCGKPSFDRVEDYGMNKWKILSYAHLEANFVFKDGHWQYDFMSDEQGTVLPDASLVTRPAGIKLPCQRTPYTADLRFEFAQVPAGEFEMGCSPGTRFCGDEEKPQHHIRITKSFEIGKYPITQAMWKAVMGNNPSHFPGESRPVEQVNWYDAQEFLQKLNTRNDGYRYRLPTEAEREYAARAGSSSAYYGDINAISWHGANSDGKTHSVGQKQPNAWGLYDMLGNVAEWVQDWYDENYYQYSPGTDPPGPSSGQYRVLRGASFGDGFLIISVSSRGRYAPGVRQGNFGFRCVREPVH
jgi:formylglycine-generating enzyme required for sulfatase activity